MTVAQTTVTALLDAADKSGVTAIILAEILGVTRQTIYLYRRGMIPDENKLRIMRDLTQRLVAAVNNKTLPLPKMDATGAVLEAIDYPHYKQP